MWEIIKQPSSNKAHSKEGQKTYREISLKKCMPDIYGNTVCIVLMYSRFFYKNQGKYASVSVYQLRIFVGSCLSSFPIILTDLFESKRWTLINMSHSLPLGKILQNVHDIIEIHRAMHLKFILMYRSHFYLNLSLLTFRVKVVSITQEVTRIY